MLKKLLKKAHELKIKIVLDIVFNHTAPDSNLVKLHPEWFYHDEDVSSIFFLSKLSL